MCRVDCDRRAGSARPDLGHLRRTALSGPADTVRRAGQPRASTGGSGIQGCDRLRESARDPAGVQGDVLETLRQGHPTTVPVRSLVVEVIGGPDAGLRVTGVDVMIGTAEGSTVRLTDPAVSRYHAELSPVTGGVAVADHGSTNGTFAGGVRIDRGVVPIGTQLRVGDSVLRVGDGSP
ncbi:MAG TPA: FHA domain-containing protein, partial [Kofleriaceae bacterium]|nr:FHA domain-containing protein [Kofleriaceae bacterium]